MERILMKEEDQFSKFEDYGYEQKVRNEMIRACGLAKQLEQQLMLAPYGSLVEPSNHELRVSFCGLLFDTAASFHNVIMLLESKSFGLQQHEASTSWSKARIPLGKKNTHGKHSSEAEDPAVGRRNWCAFPLSPSGTANAGAVHTPSPPLSSSDITEGSPARPSWLELDSGDPEEPTAAGRSAGQKIEYTDGFEEHGDGDGGHKPESLRKRKPLSKITIRVPCVRLDKRNEMLPDDGHVWRKYGQKEIVGARYPRSYYRCTHRNETGCTALKYVQKSDEDPKFFDVTYRSHHSCQLPSHLDASFWTVAAPLLSRSPTERSPASQYTLGDIGFSPSSPIPSPIFQLPFLSSLTSNPPQNSTVTLQSSDISSFSASVITPNLGSAAVDKVKLEHASNLAVNDNMLNTSDQVSNLVRSENFQPSAMDCCKSSGITMEPNRISSLSGEFERGATEVTGYNDDMLRELENYCMTEQASADCRFPLEPPQIFHPFVASYPDVAEISFHRDHTEQSLASEVETIQVGTSHDPGSFPLFADELLYMED